MVKLIQTKGGYIFLSKKSLFSHKNKRLWLYVPAFLIVVSLCYLGFEAYYREIQLQAQYNASSALSRRILQLTNMHNLLKARIDSAKELYTGVDMVALEQKMSDLWQLLLAQDAESAERKYYEALNEYNIIVVTEKQKRELTGAITYKNNALPQVDINVIKDNQAVATIKSGNDGSFKIRLFPGKYLLKVVLGGYTEFSSEIEVASSPISFNIAMSKPTVTTASKPKTTTVSTANTNDGIYSKTVVSTDRGNFTVHLLTINLAKYRMVVDTAADGDCGNNCPVLSLEEYISRNAGFAGIHGTYFCPTAYADCAGKTNSFYFKVYNGRIGQKINWSNGLGDYLPFMKINDTTATYHDTWSEIQSSAMSSGISCRPHLVENGQIVLSASDMDSDKESVYKMTHGFLGISGQTIYAGIVLSANLYDSAAVSKALGLENSFNLDGGGTSAMFYNGSYKVGPGRAMPNAIVFKQR